MAGLFVDSRVALSSERPGSRGGSHRRSIGSPALERARRFRKIALGGALAAFSVSLWRGAALPHQLLLGRDTLGLYLPLKSFMADAFRSGRIPSWYPYDGLGFSIPGALVSGLLDPANVLLLVLTPIAAVRWSVLLCYPLAAAGGYYLGRALRLPTIAACATGAAFAASGYLLSQSANLLYLEGAARLPWVIGAAEHLGRRARVRDAGVFAIAIASVLWAGDAETLAFAVILSVVIVALRGGASRKNWVLWGLGGFIGLLLNAPVVGSAIETYAGSSRASTLAPGEALSWSLHPLRLPELVLGSAFHFNLGIGARALAFGGQNSAFWSESVFLGTATTALMLFGFASRRRGFSLYAGLGVGGLWLALGGAGRLYAHVPGLMHFRYPEKLVLWVSLAAAVGAGAGVARLSHSALPPKWAASLVAAVVVMSAFAGLWLPEYHLRGATAGAVLVAIAASTGAPRAGRGRQAVATLLIAIELALANAGLIHHGEVQKYPRVPPPIAGVRPGDRICADLALGELVRADGSIDAERLNRWQLETADLDLSGLYGLRSTVALVPTLPRELNRLCSVASICTDVCARMLGARWRVLRPTEAAPLLARGGFRQAGAWGNPPVVALEDLQAPPYASLRPARTYPDPWPLEIALHRLRQPVDEFAWVQLGTLTEPARYSGRGSVAISASHSAGRIALSTAATLPSILAVREAFSPEWHADIDGHPARVIPVDLGMIGLALAPGPHRVSLVFCPWGWPWVFVLYAIGAALSAGLLARRG